MKLVLAGCESTQYLLTAYLTGCRSFLTSYYHLLYKSKPSDTFISLYNNTKHETNFIMDSGLFTMMFGAGKNNTYDHTYLWNYTKQYIQTMKDIDFHGYIVEADVHKLLGIEKLQDYRQLFCDTWGVDRTIFVFHIEEGLDNWYKLAQQYKYIAISIPELRIVYKDKSHLLPKLIKQMVLQANQVNPNIKIHLLGNNQPNLMMQKGYTTADSTSWLYLGIAGRIGVWDQSKCKFQTIMSDYRKLDLSQDPLFKNFVDNYNKKHYLFTNKTVSPTKNYSYLYGNYLFGSEMMKLNKYVNKKYYSNEPIHSLIN